MSSDEKTQWIADYEARTPHLLGRCITATEEMSKAFPDLEIVKGHAHTVWGKRGHAWLTDSAGTIFDPTVKQFPGVFEYEPWAPGSEVRVGKCMNCGDDIWEAVQTLDVDHSGACICSDACHGEYVQYLENP